MSKSNMFQVTYMESALALHFLSAYRNLRSGSLSSKVHRVLLWKMHIVLYHSFRRKSTSSIPTNKIFIMWELRTSQLRDLIYYLGMSVRTVLTKINWVWTWCSLHFTYLWCCFVKRCFMFFLTIHSHKRFVKQILIVLTWFVYVFLIFKKIIFAANVFRISFVWHFTWDTQHWGWRPTEDSLAQNAVNTLMY